MELFMILKRVFSLVLTIFVGGILAGSVSAQKYGGTLVIGTTDQRMGFDPAGHQPDHQGSPAGHDYLIYPDVRKGTYGDGSSTLSTWSAPYASWTCGLCESWEAFPTKIVFYLKKGVKFRNKAPVNGREIDANDVLATWNAATKISNTEASGNKDKYTWTVLDKYTIQVEWNDPTAEFDKFGGLVGGWGIFPRELVEQDIDRNNWKNTYGSGPFYPSKFIKNNVTVFEKNSDYWGTDPLNPGNSLPYVDKLNVVVMDEAALKAGIVSGKIDASFWFQPWSVSDVRDLKKSNSNLVVTSGPAKTQMIPVNITRKPFSDKRLRRAVMLAINHEEMNQSLYDGTAMFPIMPTYPGSAPYYLSLEEMEKERPDLAMQYGYYPEEAKKLLAEAGYPKGFKTNMIVAEFGREAAEATSLYLSQIGIDMEIRIVEDAKMYSMTMNKKPDPTYTDMAWSDSGCTSAFASCNLAIHMDPRGPMPWMGQGNTEFEKSDYGQEFITLMDDFMKETNPDEHLKKWKKLAYWANEELWFIPLMMTSGSHFQQKWMHNYNGVIGWMNMRSHFLKYSYLDVDLRKQLSGRGAEG
jgi:peptide/nickel transport system substrate-binding protein